jgi:hypothetical protein
MSHSKPQNRGKSLYLENWNPRAKSYLLACAKCGHIGFSPSILDPGFDDTLEKKAIKKALVGTHRSIHINDAGVCEQCSSAQHR